MTIAATVAKMISERLPPGLKISAEVKEMVLEACNEFVQCVASEANEISTKENKTTIMPEHVVNALKSLDFEAYVLSELLADALATGPEAYCVCTMQVAAGFLAEVVVV